MRFIKWLWSVGIAMAVVLVYATVSSYLVDIGAWYNALKFPPLVASGQIFSIGWLIIYGVSIFILSRMMIVGAKRLPMALMLCRGTLNVVWCVVFFKLHSLSGALATLIIIIIYSIVILCMLLRDLPCCIALTADIAWLIYLAVTLFLMLRLN